MKVFEGDDGKNERKGEGREKIERASESGKERERVKEGKEKERAGGEQGRVGCGRGKSEKTGDYEENWARKILLVGVQEGRAGTTQPGQGGTRPDTLAHFNWLDWVVPASCLCLYSLFPLFISHEGKDRMSLGCG